MASQKGFISFCGVVLTALLGFQLLLGCGQTNLFGGNASRVLKAREAYYAKNYTLAVSLSSLVTQDAGASGSEKQQANYWISQSILAQSGNSLVDIVGRASADTFSRLRSSSGGTQDVSSVFSSLIPTQETSRQQIIQAATAVNQAGIGTQDAQAVNVAIVNAQAAMIQMTNAFDTNRDGQIQATDVSTLSATQVTALYVQANAGSTSFGAVGGISQFLNNASTYGGGAFGSQVSVESTSVGTGDVQSIHQRFINGEISGEALSRMFGGR